MKQFQFEYVDASHLQKDLETVNKWRNENVSYSVVFQIYTETLDSECVSRVCRIITDSIPSALYMGCSTNGGIFKGGLSKASMVIVCTVFEKPSTKVEIVQYTMTDSNSGGVANALLHAIDARPWVKAISLFVTIRGLSMSNFCEILYGVRPNVHIFGGGAFNPDLNSDTACVFSNVGSFTNHAVALMLVGGDDFFVDSTFISGWKPLGREFKVTRAEGSLLQELDGRPAFGIYHRYLGISNDNRFFNNTLEFPFFYKKNGIDILRAPTASTPDGSLVMTSDIEESVVARMAYGDPDTILESVYSDCARIAKFAPQVIQVFSCAGRRTFWGDAEVGNETAPFQTIAPTSGFYTSSEFLRTKGFVNQHNVTLVVAAMREGASANEARFKKPENAIGSKVSMISRLAKFIEAATAELASANVNVEALAVNDALTKFLNRSEIQKRIVLEMEKTQLSRTPFATILLNIDDFRSINDTFGTLAGDEVLSTVSDALRKLIREYAPLAVVGRYSGDEFLMVLPGYNEIKALALAENIRATLWKLQVGGAGNVTVSLGVSEVKPRMTVEMLLARVSKALTSAKENGKNRVVML